MDRVSTSSQGLTRAAVEKLKLLNDFSLDDKGQAIQLPWHSAYPIMKLIPRLSRLNHFPSHVEFSLKRCYAADFTFHKMIGNRCAHQCADHEYE